MKTILLVFIHGFKGGDDTFAGFPEHFRALVSHALPAVRVVTAVYPKYETRGNLKECVSRFREWLQNKVIDIEVANQTPSPTVDPSVHVFLIGHSMGGIIGAETILLIASEQPIPPQPSLDTSGTSDGQRIVEPGSFMFPHIQGLLAFDTPFLGIAPGVVSYGAEGHFKTVTTAYNALSEVAGVFGFGGNNSSSKSATATQEQKKPLPPASTTGTTTDAAATPSWQRWGRYAMFAGAAGAVAAGGAAAMYTQRQRITDGWSWVSSHLVFVGCLARPAELRQRLAVLSQLQQERGIRCTNFYTCLGKGAPSLVEEKKPGTASFSQKIIRSKNRTFCTLPTAVDTEDTRANSELGLQWLKAANDKATDEVKAHISMFLPKDNPAFYVLAHQACDVLMQSIDKGWYSTATGPVEEVVNERPQNTRNGSQTNADSGSTDVDSDGVVVVN